MPSKKSLKASRNRRQPVQLIDFLRADGAQPKPAQSINSQSAATNVSPVISSTNTTTASAAASASGERVWGRLPSAQNVNNNIASFTPTDEDFPVVGAVRKKPKTARAAVVPPADQPVGQRIGHYVRQSTSSNSLEKQQVVNKWLKTVQQPIAQSQQLSTQLSQFGASQYETTVSAPAPAVSQQQQSQGTHQQQAPPCAAGSKMMPPPAISGNQPSGHAQQASFAQSVPHCPVTGPNMTMSLPVDGAMRTAPKIRSVSGEAARTAVPVNERVVHETDGTQLPQHQWRRNDRRVQREQAPHINARREHPGLPSQLPDELMMQPPSPVHSGRDDDDASFVLELQQALAANAPLTQSQLQLDNIAAHSTLNWNANEFRPMQGSALAREPRNMISERRRRQRFHRTLKPHALFELVSLPSDGLPQSQSTDNSQGSQATFNISPSYTDSSGAPTAAVAARTVAAATAARQLPLQNNNNNASQSVFRLASLPSTGIGTGNSSLSTIFGPSDSPTQTDAAVDFLRSPPLLNMDPPTQETEALLFLDVEELENLSEVSDVDQESPNMPHRRNKAFPRHIIFVSRDSPQRRNFDVDLNFMPKSIKKLYRLICSKYSDYAFVYALSAQLSQECVPMECYVYLKMALLSSLVSIELDDLRAPISLCVICADSCVANRLLHNVGQLAPRFIGPHEGGQQPTQTALPSRYNWVVASPLLLAQQGVYFAGDWNRLSRDQTEELEKCIENGSVPVPQLQSAQPLETAIWTYWQPENAANQTTAFAKLCPIFGLPVYMDQQVNETMWDFVLRQYRRDEREDATQDAFNIPLDDTRTLLELLQHRQVAFTDEAQQLLQKYYVVSRIEQPTAFSSKTYIVLKQFAESIAKLAMRLDVLEADVTVVIFHCEHFVRSIFGAGSYPPPAVASFNVISRIDPYMNEFARWLYQYLDRYEDNLDVDSRHPKRQRIESF
ncbi:uncharacterized protein LOC115766395 isoform X1 [Drosophila novamexicana]|uniref:uncharacterized protein LOC115766395 isoform X1 n=2 Tax=Drosophila novamexicana TaxID=47314 RepID=UPI0011E5F373|nr:uncharacterized protein LOC115766395 isoform X1 [Drosophila novamexicana]